MAHNDAGGSGGGGGGTPSSEASAKRNRGRPPGSVKRQLDALGFALIFSIGFLCFYVCVCMYIWTLQHHEVSLFVSRSARSWFYASCYYGECWRGKVDIAILVMLHLLQDHEAKHCANFLISHA